MSLLPPPCAPPVPLNLYYGVQSVFVNLSMAFWGITCMQTFLYFVNYNNDRMSLKILVLSLWVLDTTHQCLLVSAVYEDIITGRILEPDKINGQYFITVILTTFVSTPVKGYFTYRIYKFTHNGILNAALVFGTFVGLVAGVVMFAVEVHSTTAAQITDNFRKPMILVEFSLNAILDLALALCLCYFLWRKSFSHVPRLKSTTMMLRSLTLITVNTGLWTAIISVITGVLAYVYSNNYLYISFYLLHSPLYCNSLLCSLNTRTYVRSEGEKHRRRVNVVQLSALETSQSTEGPVQFRPIKVTQNDSAEAGASGSQTEDAESSKGGEQNVI
ncbi:hypothetical protein BC629DRAFT_1195259 [Irpex lacteus]|nr:hypothetical protein BC629DRAFT_1195259 [Irpex lacteus]